MCLTSIAALEALLNDKFEFADFLAEQGFVRDVEASVERAEREVESLAQRNLSRRAEIDTLLAECGSLRDEQERERAELAQLTQRHLDITKV